MNWTYASALALTGVGMVLWSRVVWGIDATRPKATNVEYDVEVYTSAGRTNGCGVDFLGTWATFDHRHIGIKGSFTAMSGDKGMIGMIKGTVAYADKLIAPPYLWMDIQEYGRTNKFIKGAASDPRSIVTGIAGDPKLSAVPLMIGAHGFVVGVTLPGDTTDELAEFPPVPADVMKKIQDCEADFARTLGGDLPR